MLNLVENGPVVLEKIFKFRQCIFDISWLSPLGNKCGPSFVQTRIPFTQGCFVPSLVKLAQWFWRRIFLEISSMYFPYFVIISPWKWGWPFIWTNLSLLYPSFVPRLVELARWFWRGRFLNFINVFSLYCDYFPMEMGPSFEQTWIPFTQGYFVLSLVEIGTIFKFHWCIFPILWSPLGNRRGPSFEQNWIPTTQGCFVPTLARRFLRGRWKWETVYDDGKWDILWSEKPFAQVS